MTIASLIKFIDNVLCNISIKIKITKITGQKLPLETHKNVAGVAGLALLEQVDASVGYEIEIYKKIKPGSGIGSSAASAAGAVFAINELLGKPFSKQELIYFAMQGEKLAALLEAMDKLNKELNFDDIEKRLRAENIEVKPLFTPLHQLPFYDDESHPISEATSKNGLILPSGTTLSQEDIEIISSKFRKVLLED